jgi:type II secretory pathway pseudopilin PulG
MQGRAAGVGFTLVELLVVISIIVAMMALALPAFNAMKGGGDVTKAAADVSGAIEVARSYAMTNNTYTWLGFFEEDPMAAAGTAGTGRIVMSIVSSIDGTTIYSKVASPATALDPARLIQVGKLIKVDNIHLKTASSTSDPVFPIGNGTGDTFATRPAVTGSTAQIGDTSPNATLTPFQYPVASSTPAPTPKYIFTKAIQFSPRGEARVNNNNYSLKPVIEIGLQPARGNTPDAAGKNVAAIQVTGIAGNVKIYRR